MQILINDSGNNTFTMYSSNFKKIFFYANRLNRLNSFVRITTKAYIIVFLAKYPLQGADRLHVLLLRITSHSGRVWVEQVAWFFRILFKLLVPPAVLLYNVTHIERMKIQQISNFKLHNCQKKCPNSSWCQWEPCIRFVCTWARPVSFQIPWN